MSIRKIEYTVKINEITPPTQQQGGVQGEHNATELVFLLDGALISAVREAAGKLGAESVFYRFDGYTGTGTKSSTEPLALPHGDTVTLTYPLENWLTRDGGNIQVYLVITAVKDGETQLDIYSLPALIRLKNTPAGEYAGTENYESVSTLAQVAKKSAEEAKAAEENIEQTLASKMDKFSDVSYKADRGYSVDCGDRVSFSAIRYYFYADEGITVSSSSPMRISAPKLQLDNFHGGYSAPMLVEGVAEPVGDTDAANKAYVDNSIGSIETALDSIIAIQEQLIGGAE